MRIGKGCAAVLLGALLGADPVPAAALSNVELKCSLAIAKAGASFVRGKLKAFQACRNAGLAGGTCASPAPAVLGKADAVLAATLANRCAIGVSGLGALGFPGPCQDADVADGFTPADLAACIRTSHDAAVSSMLALQYDAAVSGPLPKADLACQQEVARRSAGLAVCVLKAVQQCRAAILNGKLAGVPAHLCASADARTAAAIAKCRLKLAAGIGDRCRDAQVASLQLCAPDQATVAGAATCLIDAHAVLVDGPAIDVPADLIDFEYAVRGGLCGDGVVNDPQEECDGDDDTACPGLCGAALVPDGYFACLCRNKPRLRVVEHGGADTDNGWTGSSADADIAEGGGYVVDLYDCDGSGLCLVGPSCSLPPHSPCSVAATAPSGTTSNAICAALGEGVCRKERTATGPHCFQDIQKKCDPAQATDPVCDAPGDFCRVTLRAPPNPAASGGVTVCNVTLFSEDIVGTANLLTGEAAVKARQRARTYQNLVGAANKPCPVCGGFCGVSRQRCEVDTDCAAGKGPCITAPVCSNGPNVDKPCRPSPPFGSVVPLFGTTSVDCPPDGRAEITVDGGLDLDVTRRTTGLASMAPTIGCSGAGFTGDACRGGASEGRPCTSASACPGGSCAPQCFCPGQIRPNACGAACVGGAYDALECAHDGECAGGFCHAGDCRVDPGDDGSVQEGICTVGPINGTCSVTNYRACTVDADCGGSTCPFCESGESCVLKKRACFVNSGIVRQGTPRTPEGVSVGVYCISANTPAANTVAGFPGPAAFTQPELAIRVP